MINCNYIKQEINQKLDKKYFLSADFETTKIEKTEKQKLIVCGLTDGSNYYYCTTIKDFINLINRLDQKIIYFHNLGYDFRFFIEYFNNSQYQYNIIFAQSRVISFIVKDINNKILFEFRDSYALFPMKLRAVNNAYNKIYFKDIEYELEEKLTLDMIKYLKLDCLSLFESLSNFQYLMGLKKINLTIGAIARNEWEKTYEHKKININHAYYDFFKKSMYGGRTEVFKRHGKDLNYYDVNSLYPAVMQNNKYPIGEIIPIEFENETKFHISYVKNIRIPDINIPAMPVKDKNKGTIYPIGILKNGIYNSIDLNYFHSQGIEYDFVEGIGWNESDYIFKNFINKTYPIKLKAKENGNKGVYETTKRLMNALSGKMGQNPNHIQFMKIIKPKEFFKIKKKALSMQSTIFDNIYAVESESKKPIRNHILSFIYSYARKILHEKMLEIQEIGGNIYYCDTDSIFTDIQISNHPTNLGQWSLEEEKIKEGYFALPKSYALKLSEKRQKELIEKNKNPNTVKFKGFNVESIEFKNIKNYVENNEPITENRTIVSTLKRIMGGSMGIYECDNFKKEVKESAFLKREKIGKYDTKPITLKE